jgi:hypothetical protein
MPTRPAADNLFKGRHFDQNIILLCIRWYLSFKLSSRDLVQMMSEPGIVWHIPQFSVGFSAMFLNLKSGGVGMPGR